MRRLLLASVLVLPTAPAAAQCGTWDADFAELGPGGSLRGISPYNRFLGVWDVAEYDAGSGPRLIAAGEFDFCDGASTNRLAAFDGTTWSALGDGVGTPFGGDFQNMAFTAAVFDAGGGPELYVGGSFASAGAPPRLATRRHVTVVGAPPPMPDPTEDQLVPFHRATRLAATPPALAK